MAVDLQFTTAQYSAHLHEVDAAHWLTPPALIGYLQEVAWYASVRADVEIPRLLAQGLTWVLARLQVQVYRYPRYGEMFEARTWASAHTAEKYSIQRNIELYLGDTLAAQAYTQWLVVDMEKKKLIAAPDFVRQAILHPTRPATHMGKDKISSLTHAAFQRQFQVGYFDLDMNTHTNHLHYIRWALETLPADFLANHCLKSLDIQFKAESRQGEGLSVQTEIHQDNTFLHRIATLEDDKEIIRARSVFGAR